MNQTETIHEMLERMRHDAELARFLQSQEGTRFFRRHVPSGRVAECVVTPASVRAVIGPFDPERFLSRWTQDDLLQLLARWNRQIPDQWHYWRA